MSRILMINVPFAGHTNPTLPLAAALVEAGHQVTYINAEHFREPIESTGIRFVPYADWPADLTREEEGHRCFRAIWDTALGLTESFDLLIYEMFFYPGMNLAERLGLPAVRLFAQPAWCQHPTFGQLVRTHYNCARVERTVMDRSTARHLGVDHSTLMKTIAASHPALNVVFVPEFFQVDRAGLGDEFVFSAPDIGATASAISADPAFDDLDLAALPHPRLYISLGSLLEKVTFHRQFIKALADWPGSVILNIGRADRARLGVVPDHIKPFAFVPQLTALEWADVFLTHAGMNSVNEAMALGVPMVTLPIVNDEVSNAEQVIGLGVGVSGGRRRINGRALRQAVDQVLADQAMAARSAALSREYAAAQHLDQVIARIDAILASAGDKG
ncbi:MAG: hypothetical protein LBV30_00455 [Propionibacteriaceae bacterium]|jgi:MGT family glycosyltransferase|nr:hypothetical protein [Propionibacteriaceae bacterium]